LGGIMAKKRGNQPRHILIVDYKELRTISIEELRQAIYTDMEALKDMYGVRFLTAPRLTLPITNQYGDPREIRHPEGHHISRIDTHHYRPACMDYDL